MEIRVNIILKISLRLDPDHFRLPLRSPPEKGRERHPLGTAAAAAAAVATAAGVLGLEDDPAPPPVAAKLLPFTTSCGAQDYLDIISLSLGIPILSRRPSLLHPSLPSLIPVSLHPSLHDSSSFGPRPWPPPRASNGKGRSCDGR